MNYFEVQNNFLTISANNVKSEEIVNALNKYITRQDCERMYVDISAINMLEATKIGALCSAKHFSKYPSGELKWIVKDKETCSLLEPLTLKTVKANIKRPIIEAYNLPLSV